jgi:phosphatidate cytidylyltransferase
MNPVAKRTFTGLAVGAAAICAILFIPPKAAVPVVGALVALAVAEYALLLRKKFPRVTPVSVCWLVAGAAFIAGGLSMLAMIVNTYNNVMLLYVIAIIKFSDVGGFAFGLTSAKCMKGGNHKMCPGISPNKSWEGMAGSILLSSLVSCCFIPATHFPLAKALVFGVAAAVLGTLGDLVESKFKRWIGVKDSSAMKFTNGMGGFLDMFDSLLIAPAILYFFIR